MAGHVKPPEVCGVCQQPYDEDGICKCTLTDEQEAELMKMIEDDDERKHAAEFDDANTFMRAEFLAALCDCNRDDGGVPHTGGHPALPEWDDPLQVPVTFTSGAAA
jgi:hypothetical protein